MIEKGLKSLRCQFLLHVDEPCSEKVPTNANAVENTIGLWIERQPKKQEAGMRKNADFFSKAVTTTVKPFWVASPLREEITG